MNNRGVAEKHRINLQERLSFSRPFSSYVDNVSKTNVIESLVRDAGRVECILPQVKTKPSAQNDDEKEGRLLHWTLPGQVQKSSCGVKTAVEYCPADQNHHTRLTSLHCWQLSCANCFNSAALRAGAKAEERLIAPMRLAKRAAKETGTPVRLRPPVHVVISPPQEFAARMIRTEEGYRRLEYVTKKFAAAIGLDGGAYVLHPWRQTDGTRDWRVGVHYHFIAYGYLMNTKQIQKRYPGWVVKNLGKRNSIRHTVSYLLTHAGLATYAMEPEEVDLSSEFIRLTLNRKWSKFDEPVLYSEDNNEEPAILPNDWERWTMARYRRGFHTLKWFGELSYNKLRVLGRVIKRKVARCKECDSALIRLGRDGHHEPSSFMERFRVFCWKDTYEELRERWQQLFGTHQQKEFVKSNWQLTAEFLYDEDTVGSGRRIHRLSAR